MAKFKITPTTTVAELKEQFSNEIGGVLRIYEGRSEAADGATLVSLGAKEGELECRTSRTVGKFEEAFQNDLNLKVKVYTKDNWVKVLDGITLATAAELPNGMTKAKMEEYLSYQRDEKEEENNNSNCTNVTVDWNSDNVVEVYKYIPLDELVHFLESSYIQPKNCDASDFPFISGEVLTAALKIVDGYCYCALCRTSDSEPQWKTSGNDGHGVCVKIDVNYSGWEKSSVFYSRLTPRFDNDYIRAVDALSIKPSEYSDMEEIIFVRNVSGNDGLPYRVQDVILGSNMTEEERLKCNIILGAKVISAKKDKFDDTNTKKANSKTAKTASEEYDTYTQLTVEGKDNYDIAEALGEYAEANEGDFAVVVNADGLKMFVEGHLYVNNRGGQGELDYIKVLEGELSEEDIEEIKEEFESMVSWS